jgi:hypothetical protein
MKDYGQMYSKYCSSCNSGNEKFAILFLNHKPHYFNICEECFQFFTKQNIWKCYQNSLYSKDEMAKMLALC